jgi:signal recognition particle receptor subunit beta
VRTVRVELPSLSRFKGIRFVDTPGMESVLTHNTEASYDWLPNVGLAIVAVSVDPPLSQRDLELIRELHRYTPHVSILLTKVDILDAEEGAEVQQYVRSQLDRLLDKPIPIFAYSIRLGFESVRADFERVLLQETLQRADSHRQAALQRKLETLLHECEEYLNVALKSAESADSDRRLLKERILGHPSTIQDLKLTLQLAVKHARGNTRPLNEKMLNKHEQELNQHLAQQFETVFPQWTTSLKHAAEMFEDWLLATLSDKMMTLSSQHRNEFLIPVHDVGRQLSQSLQDFRNRISEAALATLGVPLRTTELGLEVQSPQSPDIRIGKIFDRNWELLSAIVPMTLVKGILRNHFRQKIADAVLKNLSRLAFQWEEIVNAALSEMEREALARLENLVSTLDNLLSSAPRASIAIEEDLARLRHART